MPYNITPIAPPTEYNGQVALPLARTKKIINADDDISSCSNNAAFVITIATEMFVQHLVKQSYEIKSDKRQRKNLAYADVANAVARVDNLEFLADIVPKTTTIRKLLAEKGDDFKPGPQVQPQHQTEEPTANESRANGESSGSNTGLPRQAKDIMDLTNNDVNVNGHAKVEEREDVVMADVDERSNGETAFIDPIQEQLAMEMEHHGQNGT